MRKSVSVEVTWAVRFSTTEQVDVFITKLVIEVVALAASHARDSVSAAVQPAGRCRADGPVAVAESDDASGGRQSQVRQVHGPRRLRHAQPQPHIRTQHRRRHTGMSLTC